MRLSGQHRKEDKTRRQVSKIGSQTDRKVAKAEGVIDSVEEGPGPDLPEIELDWPTM